MLDNIPYFDKLTAEDGRTFSMRSHVGRRATFKSSTGPVTIAPHRRLPLADRLAFRQDMEDLDAYPY